MEDRRLTIEAELRADEPEAETPEDNTDTQENSDTTNNKDDSKDGKTVSGYAMVWNTPSKPLKDGDTSFTEIITPEALSGTDLSNVILLSNHDYSEPLASVKAGTLKLETDDKGLHFEATLPNTTAANDTYENIKAGNIDSASFRFSNVDDSWEKDDAGNITRTINQIRDLFEISTVTVPAYDDTNVAVDTRSYEKFMNKENEESKHMENTIIENTEEATETRSFEDYIRSNGETRDGLTTDGNKPIIPSEVITPIFEYKQNKANLGQYVTVKTVSTGAGIYPISVNNNATLATKAELAQIADVDSGITGVEFKVVTRAGKIFLSQEIIDDSAIPIVSEVQAQLQKLVNNTDNTNIVALLKKATKKAVTSLDDVKTTFNVDLDPALNKSVVTNQGGFNYLDQLKDNEGRYMLQADPTSPTGKSLFGAPIIVVPSVLLPDETAGSSFPMFVGDLEQYIALFKRNQVSVNWQQFDSYSSGLAVVVRNDYEVIDANAMVYLTIGAGK
ncbi:phage major capsid protein [Pediococcus claussenii]|uniref:Phage prohead protease, HK97 family n=1 Tax=Pediococcus claussenii (strain ATCC BAA-344 / DSM 14800 / JCM 18046 / KCTC 3811 / LMG 21948 / P06) TaxID=701521 RepID=G8PCB3_PEDCP|nr:phage major capsid protein [Pediococcus claussenii]AEV94898.1 phage prohead protease, HK97 family [Pediococcus claussenii ATCC BAA-344]KRN18800.1 hypothetical protein IV79_GL000350 [Pediococcus claussenii]